MARRRPTAPGRVHREEVSPDDESIDHHYYARLNTEHLCWGRPMSSVDDPQTTPELTPNTRSKLLAELITAVHSLREEVRKGFDDIKRDTNILTADAKQRNQRATELENKVSRLPCQPGGGNGVSCGHSDEGGLDA